MDREAEIVTLYEAEPPPRPRQKKRQRHGWPTVALAGFLWTMKLATVLLAGMQIRELLGH
jgi:hypothetical protein